MSSQIYNIEIRLRRIKFIPYSLSSENIPTHTLLIRLVAKIVKPDSYLIF